MSMYKTSEEGLRKIDQDTFRRMSLKELESWARSNPCNEPDDRRRGNRSLP